MTSLERPRCPSKTKSGSMTRAAPTPSSTQTRRVGESCGKCRPEPCSATESHARPIRFTMARARDRSRHLAWRNGTGPTFFPSNGLGPAVTYPACSSQICFDGGVGTQKTTQTMPAFRLAYGRLATPTMPSCAMRGSGRAMRRRPETSNPARSTSRAVDRTREHPPNTLPQSGCAMR